MHTEDLQTMMITIKQWLEMEAHQMAELHIQSSQMAMLGPLKMVAQMPMTAPHNMTVNWMLT